MTDNRSHAFADQQDQSTLRGLSPCRSAILLRSLLMPGRRSRAIKLPPVPRFNIHWYAPLFTAEDVQRIADQVKAEESRLIVADGVDSQSIAGALNQAFHNAIVSATMLDRLWRQDPAWFRRLAQDVSRLLDTLGLTAEQCTTMTVPLPSDEASPGIYHLREAARVMPLQFWPPVELLGILTDRQEIESHTDGTRTTEETENPPQTSGLSDPGEKAMADVLLQLLPRVLGLVLRLADACAATTPTRPAGAGSDTLRRELFNALVGIHVAIYGRGPWSRNKVGERRGPSIRWARLILETARDRMPAACGEGQSTESEQIWCVPVLAELANREDNTVSDWLGQAWSHQRNANRHRG
jgi:hypothetical protein